jgi:uncharacterized protein (DUF924 family)
MRANSPIDVAVKSGDEIKSVLEFWFGVSGTDGAIDPLKRKMWFGSGARHDAEIRTRFAGLHSRACRNELHSSWSTTARGRLALIVLFDQFSRHIHRGTVGAFTQDPAAQQLTLAGIDEGIDLQLAPVQRSFFYLPLEHAEDRALQARSVQCYERLATAVAEAWRKDYESFLDYARRHRAVIERFGRFPHRNALLGRLSTPDEAAFLEQPGSSF